MSKSKITPVNDRVFIVRDKAPEQSEGGILIPETVQESDQNSVNIGIVSAAHEDCAVPVGSRVAFTISGLEYAVVDGVHYIVINEDKILCVLS